MNFNILCATFILLPSLSTVTISSAQRHRSSKKFFAEETGRFLPKAMKNSRHPASIAESTGAPSAPEGMIRGKEKRDKNVDTIGKVGSIISKEGQTRGKRAARKIKGRKSGEPQTRVLIGSGAGSGKERRNREKEYLVVNRTVELLERKNTRAADRSSSPIVIFGRGIAPEIIGRILAENRGAPIGLRRIADLLIRKTKLASVADTDDDREVIADRYEKMRKNNDTDNRGEFDEDRRSGYVKYKNEYDDPFEEPEDVAVSHLFDGALVPSASVYLPVDDRNALREGLAALLSRLFETFSENNETNDDREYPEELLRELDFDISNRSNADLCQKWLDCEEKLEEAFIGDLRLPACPCHYPSRIFYEDKIWDEGQRKHCRWRDVSGETERLDVYKPGANYCIRSLLANGDGSAAAQHCCYDARRRLITRGSGAGTPNFISPEVSPLLHERIDILPWRLCKGDFSRFNEVRPPNNDNRCKENPNEDEYIRQIESTRHY